jgi:uncharacterized protein YozE (UPF0346 family)
MEKSKIFDYLKKQDKEVLIELLENIYDDMSFEQKDNNFGDIIQYTTLIKGAECEDLLSEIEVFYELSLDQHYYTPFAINSKNYMNIPEDTSRWISQISNFLIWSAKLTELGQHECAVECFETLYELIYAVDNGDEIIFADECGSGMIRADEKIYNKAFITSLSKIKESDEEFIDSVMPLIREDNYESFNYKTILEIATKTQKELLEKEIKNKNIRIRGN